MTQEAQRRPERRDTARRYRHFKHRLLLAGLLMSTGNPVLAVAPAPAATSITFNIPAQDMEAALLAFARTANVQLIIDTNALRGMTAPAIAGRYTPSQAVALMLRASPLSPVWTGPHTLAVKARSLMQPIAQRTGAFVAPAAEAQPVAEPADDRIADIIVTAQKREESLQKVPIAVSALSARDLAARGLTDVKQLQVAVPGLQIPELSGIIMPFLRGVGAATNTLSNESSVAVYLDGVYFARLPAGLLDLNNMSRVEVLKGPQGTLFGRNSTGGVINILTRDPSHDASIRGSVGYGRFDAFQGNVYATTGLSDTVAIDLSVSGKTNEGFGTVVSTGRRYGYEDQFLIRSKLLFEPSDRTRISVSGFYSWSHQDGNKGLFPGTTVGTFSAPHQIFTSDDVGYYDNLAKVDDATFKDWGVSMRIEQDLAFARLTSISAYTHTGEVVHYDLDRTPRVDFNADSRGYSRLLTQEVQLSNLPGSSLDWVLGGFYYNRFARYTEIHFISPVIFTPLFGVPGFDAPSKQHARSYAGFAQATYEVLPKLRLTGGLRYTSDKTAASGRTFLDTIPPLEVPGAPPGRTSDDRLTFKTSLDYQLTDQVLFYGSFSRGYKTGNYNLLTYSSDVPTKPETLEAFEIGMKGDFLDKRLRLNLAAFHYDLKSPQVQLMENNVVIYSNGGGARLKGVELEGQLIVAHGLNLRFNAQYLDSKYTDYLNAPANAVDTVNGGVIALPPIDAAGNRTPYAAKFTYGIGGDYVIPVGDGEVTLTADYYHNSGYYFEPDNYLHQGAYDLLSAQLKYAPTDHLAVRLWGKNLTNSEYAQIAVAAGPAAFLYRPAPPRTYGIAVDFNF